MAPPRRRRGLRLEQRYRAAAAGIDLLSHPGFGAVCRCPARRSRRAATGDLAISRSETADDRARRCRHPVAGNSRTYQRLDRTRRRAGALCRTAAGASRRRSGAGETAPRRTQPRRQPDLGKAAASRSLRRRRPVRRARGAQGRHRQPPGAGRARRGIADKELGVAGRRHAARHRRTPRQGTGVLVSRQRRHALVRSADVRLLCRDAATDRRYVRLRVGPGCGRHERGECRNGGAAAHARRLWRVRTAAFDRQAARRRFPRAGEPRSPARILRPRRWTACGEYAGGGGPHRAARYVCPAREAGQLHQFRTARPARNPAVVVAGAVPDRCRDRRVARRRDRGLLRRRAAPAALLLALLLPLRPAVADQGRQHHRRIRHQGHHADPSRLCADRQCRRRFHREGGNVRSHAVSRAAHGARGRRSGRHRSCP